MTEDIEKQKFLAVKLADNMFSSISQPEIVKVTTPEERHDILIKKYKDFARAYPLVVAKMAVTLEYNKKAFIRFLNKLYSNPGKGMEGILERQADYAKFLYQEESKRLGNRWNAETSKRVWEAEFQNMNDWVQKTKKSEKKIKNSLKEESEKHLEECRSELLDFIRNEEKETDETDYDLNELLKEFQETEEIKTSEEITQESTINEKVEKAIKEREEYEKQQRQKQYSQDWTNNSIMSSWKKSSKR